MKFEETIKRQSGFSEESRGNTGRLLRKKYD